MIVWVDVETTGLDVLTDKLLEIAVIVTDDKLQELARFERVTDQARFVDFEKVDPVVREMHAGNGLWVESLLRPSDQLANGHYTGGKLDQVDWALADFLLDQIFDGVEPRERYEVRRDPAAWRARQPVLAGSTVSFDRDFIHHYLPRTFDLLHYRNLDVSSLNEVAKRQWPAVWEGRPRGGDKLHRAMGDIEESLAVARYYCATLGPVTHANDLSTGTGRHEHWIATGEAEGLVPGPGSTLDEERDMSLSGMLARMPELSAPTRSGESGWWRIPAAADDAGYLMARGEEEAHLAHEALTQLPDILGQLQRANEAIAQLTRHNDLLVQELTTLRVQGAKALVAIEDFDLEPENTRPADPAVTADGGCVLTSRADGMLSVREARVLAARLLRSAKRAERFAAMTASETS